MKNRTKLFDHWPTYLEDFADCKEIMGYRYPETLVETFLGLKLDKDVKIIDVACGAGNVPYILKSADCQDSLFYLSNFKLAKMCRSMMTILEFLNSIDFYIPTINLICTV